MMAMTTTTETPVNPATGETTTETHRVAFSNPDVVKAPVVRDPDASRRAAQAPVFSSAY